MVHSGGLYKGGVGLVSTADSQLLGSPFDPDVRGKDAWQCVGSPRRLIPMMVFHGTYDIVVNSENGDQTIRQFLQTNDDGDDGLNNDSISYRSTSTTRQSVPGGRSYTVDTYQYGGKIVAQKYTIERMNHAWSGGTPGWAFSDELGPDASQISWNFVKRHRR
jgi:poly(3-hydroxybutyrate) depolymerase